MVYRCLEKTAGPPICNVSAEKKQRETCRRCWSKTSTICVPINPISVCFVTINGGLALLVVCDYLAWLDSLLIFISVLTFCPPYMWLRAQSDFIVLVLDLGQLLTLTEHIFLIVSWLCDIGKRNTWKKSSFQTHVKHFERVYLNINHFIRNLTSDRKLSRQVQIPSLLSESPTHNSLNQGGLLWHNLDKKQKSYDIIIY